jgi:hypothetical protein
MEDSSILSFRIKLIQSRPVNKSTQVNFKKVGQGASEE